MMEIAIEVLSHAIVLVSIVGAIVAGHRAAWTGGESNNNLPNVLLGISIFVYICAIYARLFPDYEDSAAYYDSWLKVVFGLVSSPFMSICAIVMFNAGKEAEREGGAKARPTNPPARKPSSIRTMLFGRG